MVERVRVDRAEVALDSSNFFFEDLVPETRLELSLPKRCCGDAHRVLAASEENLGEARVCKPTFKRPRRVSAHMVLLAQWLRC